MFVDNYTIICFTFFLMLKPRASICSFTDGDGGMLFCPLLCFFAQKQVILHGDFVCSNSTHFSACQI